MIRWRSGANRNASGERREIGRSVKVSTDDGVFQLMKGIDTKGIEVKDFSKTYRALEGYDIEKLYVDQASLDARGLTEDDLIVDVTVLSVDEMANLMAEQDVVISF
jgi:tRNA 2-thiouridine synthesizing protein C